MCEKKEYPIEILPKSNFIQKIDIKSLEEKNDNIFVTRRIEKSKIKDGIYTDESLGQIRSFSTNLVGGLFDADIHTFFRPSVENPDWDGKTIINPKDEEYEYLSPQDYIYVFFNSKDIEISFPYDKGFQDEGKLKEFLDKLDDVSKKKFKQEGERLKSLAYVTFKHSPTNWNYWHVTAETSFPQSKEPITSDGYIGEEKEKNAENKVMKLIKHNFIEKIITSKPDYKTIEKNFYIKKAETEG